MRSKLLLYLLLALAGSANAQAPAWSPYLSVTYKYSNPDGSTKLQVEVKKDTVFYRSFEPGKEMNKKVFIGKDDQQKLRNLMEEHKFLSLNTKKDAKDHGPASYTYIMDKFMKVIYEPNNSKRHAKFEAFSKGFLGVVLPIVFKEELKGSWK